MVSSSALRWRGLRSSSRPARPRRLTCTGPRSADSRGAEGVQALERRVGRAQHRLDQVSPGARRREHVPQEQPLGQLGALLLAELASRLGGHGGARGGEAGEALGRRVAELVVAQLRAPAIGQRFVDVIRVRAQEAVAPVVQPLRDRVRGGVLALGAARPCREPRQQRLAADEELARRAGVGVEAAGLRWCGRRSPGRDLRLRQPGSLESVDRRAQLPTICHSLWVVEGSTGWL